MSNKLDDHEIGKINLIVGRCSATGCQVPKLHLGFLNSFTGNAHIYLAGLSTESYGSVFFLRVVDPYTPEQVLIERERW